MPPLAAIGFSVLTKNKDTKIFYSTNLFVYLVEIWKIQLLI
jgi:hypothetical protein